MRNLHLTSSLNLFLANPYFFLSSWPSSYVAFLHLSSYNSSEISIEDRNDLLYSGVKMDMNTVFQRLNQNHGKHFL